jgi:hypothetical protein
VREKDIGPTHARGMLLGRTSAGQRHAPGSHVRWPTVRDEVKRCLFKHAQTHRKSATRAPLSLVASSTNQSLRLITESRVQSEQAYKLGSRCVHVRQFLPSTSVSSNIKRYKRGVALLASNHVDCATNAGTCAIELSVGQCGDCILRPAVVWWQGSCSWLVTDFMVGVST